MVLQRATCRNLSQRDFDHEPCTRTAPWRPTWTSIQGRPIPLVPLDGRPDILLSADGRLFANAASILLPDRAGRRVIRCVELTPGEQKELRRRIADLTGDLLVGLTKKKTAKKRGG